MRAQRRTFVAHPAAVVAMGAFAHWFASTRGVGKLPLQFLLKDQLGVSPTMMARFFFTAAIVLYLKPLPGVLSDKARAHGVGRRAWLVGSALAGAALWGLAGVWPVSYRGLLVVAACVNAMAAVGEAAVGGLLVDYGLARGVAGRMVALRQGAVAAAIVTAWLLGGWLSGRSLGLLGAAGAVPLLALSLVSSCLREEAAAVTPEEHAPAATPARRSALGRVAGIVFLFTIAPGFQGTVLYYYQTNTLRLTSPQIGLLNTINSGAGVIAALVYTRLCRRIEFRSLLIGGIAANAASSLFYLAYRALPAAVLVEIANGAVATMGILAVHHLAARAAPPGGEALGYSLLLGVEKLAYDLSDVWGAYLHERLGLSLSDLAVVNAGGTALALLVLPVLPSSLLRDEPSGHRPAADP